MGYGLVLTFDSDLDAGVRSLWRHLELAELGVTPGQLHEPPHVTLADSETASPEALWEASLAFHPVDAGLGLLPFGIFPGKSLVVYYNVTLCEALQKAYLAYYESLRGRGVDFNLHYSPDSMIFHCTMATEIEPSALREAAELILREGGPLQGSAAAIELWRYFPVQPLHRRSLSEGAP